MAMMEWLAETWIIRILFFLIAYYAANSQIDRATRKANSAEYRARRAERALENAQSDIRINANECVELRKRVSYLEEKMDEYVRVLEALSVPFASSAVEDDGDRVASRGVCGSSSVDVEALSGAQVGIPASTAQARLDSSLSHKQQPRQHQQHYIIRSSDGAKEPTGRSSSSSDQSTSSSLERISGLRDRLESRKDSVISALNNLSGRRSNRGSRSGGISASSIYHTMPGRALVRMARRSRSKASDSEAIE
ncbi:uncharacterized protein CIMG_01873 [Coccidioides immitis RS]|uniref:Uncharacterized protein n=1 Tax=Coccidioides immitis (strain RS) TaxID=246410 RepID=J3KK50_COCIM|nr:uncharacterized protein CIMG_01873 [Coccidioides immitis RS]EAS36519.3 hypothetical protein CIMG_01873 [Coccidioides immitis RS]